MKNKLITSLVAATFALSGSVVNAAGELNIYNWGNYTPPDLIEKFEKDINAWKYFDKKKTFRKIRSSGLTQKIMKASRFFSRPTLSI